MNPNVRIDEILSMIELLVNKSEDTPWEERARRVWDRASSEQRAALQEFAAWFGEDSEVVDE